MTPAIVERPVEAGDLPAIRALHAQVFGPGRFARTAYRVREGTPAISAYCRAALCGNSLVASLRMTLVAIGGAGPHLLLGPLAVAPAFTGRGFGRSLVSSALAHAKRDGIGLVVLVGDLSYYERFGFASVPPGQISFPGPVNPARILACELTRGANARGILTPLSL
jgi:predicted N-acetyltransferase YhbS